MNLETDFRTLGHSFIPWKKLMGKITRFKFFTDKISCLNEHANTREFSEHRVQPAGNSLRVQHTANLITSTQKNKVLPHHNDDISGSPRAPAVPHRLPFLSRETD